jgi:hypothetical protein
LLIINGWGKIPEEQGKISLLALLSGKTIFLSDHVVVLSRLVRQSISEWYQICVIT